MNSNWLRALSNRAQIEETCNSIANTINAYGIDVSKLKIMIERGDTTIVLDEGVFSEKDDCVVGRIQLLVKELLTSIFYDGSGKVYIKLVAEASRGLDDDMGENDR